MPLYEYQCDACGHSFEVIQKFSDPLIESCPSCGGRVRKLQSAPAFQFKGTGWYITDYGKKEQKPPVKGEDGKLESAKGERKADEGAATAHARDEKTKDAATSSSRSESAPSSPSSTATEPSSKRDS